MMAHGSDRCDDLRSPSYANFGISLFIVVGMLISYLPQHHRIISRRSSEGMSPYYVLLGATSSTSALTNIVTLPASLNSLACCRKVNGFECFAGLLGIAQIGVQWVCFSVILLLFVLFFPHATPLSPPRNLKSTPSYRTALFVSLVCVLHAVFAFLLSALMIYQFPINLQSWANTMGVLATCLAAIQFIPQIFTTWRLQAVGAMSILAMCIQTPGSFVFVGSLVMRLGIQGWSTWGIYLVTGILQGMILTMCISFEIRDWRRRKETRANEALKGNGHVGDEDADRHGNSDTENTTLLGNER